MSKLRINLQLTMPGKKPVQKPVVVEPDLDIIMTEIKNKFQLKKKDAPKTFILDTHGQAVPLEHALADDLLANGMTVHIGQLPASEATSGPAATLPSAEKSAFDEDYYDAEGAKLLSECKTHRPLDVIWQHPETKACLYCGNITAARNLDMLRKHSITHIVNCTSNLDNFFEDTAPEISYFRINMSAHDKDVGNDEEAVIFVMPLLEFVSTALGSGASVLVHCKAGAHRAGTAAIICLMHFGGLTDSEAIAEARRRRVAIDKGFGGMGSFPQFMSRVSRAWARKRRADVNKNSYDDIYGATEDAASDAEVA